MEQFLGGWSTITPLGLVIAMLAGIYVALNRGTLWTGKQHAESMAQKDEIIAIHKERGDKLEAGYAEQVRQNGILVDQLKVFGHFIEDADRVARRAPSSGDGSSVEGSGYVRT